MENLSETRILSSQDHLRSKRASAWKELSGTIVAERYSIEHKLGEGGMGFVYCAKHLALNKRVAIKVIAPKHWGSKDVCRRFLQEARNLSSIHHEHIVEVMDYSPPSHEPPFFVMEYLQGEDLGRILQREGSISLERAIYLIRQLCQALHAAHHQGIIHRDIKPRNCFLTKSQTGQECIKLLDFGLSKEIIGSGLDPETRCGTPGYAAPELVFGRGRQDVRVDVYSTAVLLYTLLTAKHPPEQLTSSHRPEGVSKQLWSVIERATRPDPKQRFANIHDFEQALVRAWTPSQSKQKRHQIIKGTATLLLCILLGGTSSWNLKNQEQFPPVYKNMDFPDDGTQSLDLPVIPFSQQDFTSSHNSEKAKDAKNNYRQTSNRQLEFSEQSAQNILNQHRKEIRKCGRKSLFVASVGGNAREVATVSVNRLGRVHGILIPFYDFSSCVKRIIQAVHFPKTQTGGHFEFTFTVASK